MGFFDDEPVKRTLGIRDKQILWKKANGKCDNCGKPIDFTEMQVGHKIAYSRGGRTTLKNSACLCYSCNKLQGTDSWKMFQKKQGKESIDTTAKKTLKNLSMRELKFLTKKYRIKVKGSVEEGIWDDYRKPPSKAKYVNALSKVFQNRDINNELDNIPKPEKKRRKARQESSWF